MALSCEGLQELLLSDVLSLERPEYEAQRRSLEADIYHLKQQIKNAEVSLELPICITTEVNTHNV